jgi:hypothetical protein
VADGIFRRLSFFGTFNGKMGTPDALRHLSIFCLEAALLGHSTHSIYDGTQIPLLHIYFTPSNE